MADWYVDFTATGARTGLTPADAHKSLQDKWNGYYSAHPEFNGNQNNNWDYYFPGDRVWVRRNRQETLSGSNIYHSMYDYDGYWWDAVTNTQIWNPNQSWTEGVFSIIAWPNPGEYMYDQRPAAGISAGWDSDPAVKPTVAFSITSDLGFGVGLFFLDHLPLYMAGMKFQFYRSTVGLPPAAYHDSGCSVWFMDGNSTIYKGSPRYFIYDNVEWDVNAGEVQLDEGSDCIYSDVVFHQCKINNPQYDPRPTVGTDGKSFDPFYDWFYNGIRIRLIGTTIDAVWMWDDRPLHGAMAVNVGSLIKKAGDMPWNGPSGWGTAGYIGKTPLETGMPTTEDFQMVGSAIGDSVGTLQDPADPADLTSADHIHRVGNVPLSGRGGKIHVRTTHNTSADSAVAIRESTYKAIKVITTDARPGSSTNFRFQLVCNTDQWKYSWENGGSVPDYPGPGQPKSRKAFSFPQRGATNVFPTKLRDTFKFSVDETTSSAQIYVKCAGYNPGTYGGSYPTKDSMFFVVSYPTATGFTTVQSEVSLTANDTWTALPVSISGARAGTAFGFIVFNPIQDYPGSTWTAGFANMETVRLGTYPDWALYVDPVVEVA